MAHEPLRTVLHHLRRLGGVPDGSGVGDAQLVERFVRSRDEAAFELLVRRHERLVLNVCRRVLPDSHDAEDAFQATFLVLVRKAASIGKRDSVAGWLYRVAYRVALRARSRSACRAAREKPADLAALPAPEVPDAAWRELRPLLDQEVGHLPEKYRVPVVLCYLESRTYDEAARELGCSRGTVSTRLTRARELLRRRLARRGLTLSGALLAALLVERSASAAAPAGLAEAAMRAATTGVVPAQVLSLTQGALQAMFVTKLKTLAGAVLAVAIVGAGTGVLVHRAAFGQPEPLPNDRQAEEPPPPGPQTSGLDQSTRTAPPERPAEPAAPVDSWRPRADIVTGTDHVMSLAFSPDGRLLVTGNQDGTLSLWDVASGKEVRRFRQGGQVFSVAFSPDGKVLATGGGERGKAGEVRLWDAASGRELTALREHEDLIVSVAFAPDGRSLAAGSRDGLVTLWDVGVLRRRARWPGLGPAVYDVAFSPDGKRLASAGGEEFLRDGQRDGTLRLWDATSGKQVAAIQGHAGTVTSVAFSPDGKTLASGGFDRTVRVWDVATGRALFLFKGHTGLVRCVAISPDGKYLASGGFDGTVKVWDLATGRELARLKGPAGGVMSVAFSPDGRVLAAGGGIPGKPGLVILWNVASAPGAGRSAAPVGRLDRLLDDLLKTDRSDEQIVEALFLATLARLPADGEAKRILAKAAEKDRRQAFNDALWALINSREFADHLREWRLIETGKLSDHLRHLNQENP
jgi:RNA polymerase sigma factor (sigma-70 family)